MKTKVIEHYLVPMWAGYNDAAIISYLSIPSPVYPFRLMVEEFKHPPNSLSGWLHAYIVEDYN